MAKFVMACPTCGQKLKASAEHIGKKAKCTGCGNPVLVQAPEPDVPAEPSSDSELWPFDDEPVALPPKKRPRSAPPVSPGPAVAIETKPQRTRQTGRQYPMAVVAAAALVGIAAGYFAGREHLKHQMLSAFQAVGQQFAKGMGEALGGSDSDTEHKTSTVEAASPPVEWGAPYKCDTFELRLDSAAIRKIPLKDSIGGEDNVSKDDLLMLTFTVRNIHDRKLLTFHSGNSITSPWDLHDDVNNRIRGIDFGFASEVVGSIEDADDIPPGESRTHVEVFSVPPPKTQHMILKLDTEALGSEGDISFMIPRDQIQGL